MGEVYRARDTSLGREVAIKVLPAGLSSDPDRLRRFTQEAQATAALNHPNILAIYHVGEQDGAPYIVSELLEGETVRDRLKAGALPVRKAVDYAMQVAGGLAAAHEKGIVHRDLKPENLFITNDGRVKILDFGLAKLIRPDGSSEDEGQTVTAGTGAGMVLGTIGYMSPEQVRAQPVDARTDLFTLGVILYEMVSGKRAFHGSTPADTMSAILREEPEPLTASTTSVPPALDRIVRHCLEKNPFERFQTARDLKFDLSEITSISGTTSQVSGIQALPAPSGKPRRGLLGAAAVVGLALAGAAGWWAHRPTAESQPAFHRLTFRRGTVATARFAPDQKTVVYGAAWDGAPVEAFLVTTDSPESRSLGIPGSDIFAISPSSELALSLRPNGVLPPNAATLARAPLLAGAAPREIMDKVEFADWGANGSMAVTLDTGVGDRLEYPVGTMLYEAPGPIHQIRVSPDGALVAFWESGQGKFSIAVIDKKKQKQTLVNGWPSVNGLAWSPDGREVWFAGEEGDGKGWGVYGVTLAGARRMILRFAGPISLEDVAPGGHVLVCRRNSQTGIHYLAAGAQQEKELSWLDGSQAAGLSSDGQWLLFEEAGEAGGPDGAVYIRKTDGSAAVKLGDGTAFGLSPDGKYALTLTRSEQQLRLLPVGVGNARNIPGKFDRYEAAQWLPDGRIVVVAMEHGHDPRVYVQRTDGEPRAISPEGLFGRPIVAPDGRRMVVRFNGTVVLLNTEGGAPQPVPGLTVRDSLVAWSADGQSLFVGERHSATTTVSRVNLSSGARVAWKPIVPGDLAGVQSLSRLILGADEKSYAYSYTRTLGELYIVDGLH